MNKIRINNYYIENPKINNTITIASISDLHSNYYLLNKVYELLKKLHLDLIIIPGDIFDYTNNKRNKDIIELLNKISNITKTYVVLGNHDISKKIIKEIPDYDSEILKELEKNTNCILLKEEFKNIKYNKNIDINALNMSLEYYNKRENKDMFNKVLRKYNISDKNKYNILLTHSSNSIVNKGLISKEGILKDIDLIVSGHNHGCLTPKFIQKRSKHHIGLVGPYGKIFCKDEYGTYSNNKTNLIINNGITKIAKSSVLGFISKTLNKLFVPDVDIISLKNGKNNSIIEESKYLHI